MSEKEAGKERERGGGMCVMLLAIQVSSLVR